MWKSCSICKKSIKLKYQSTKKLENGRVIAELHKGTCGYCGNTIESMSCWDLKPSLNITQPLILGG